MTDRYPMTTDQPAQIDCRRMDCCWNAGGGNRANVSPAITLHMGGKALCWTQDKREEDGVSETKSEYGGIEFPALVKVSNYGEHWMDVPDFVDAGQYIVTLTPVPQEPELELEPCPFCGGEVMRSTYHESYDGKSVCVYSHVDNVCVMHRVEIVAESVREADARWNRRDA